MKNIPSKAQIRRSLAAQWTAKAKDYDRETFLWQPDKVDGMRIDPILVKDLTIDHLANIINYISEYQHWYDEAVREFMIKEAEYRSLPAFANNEPFIQCGEDGKYRVINEK